MNDRTWALWIVALFCSVGAGGASTTPTAQLEAALAAYDAGQFAEAVVGFETLVRAGFDDGRLHYDLGNAHLRASDLGRAIASYRRAAQRLPRDSDIAANLAFARKSARDAIAPPQPPSVVRALGFWHFLLGPAELRWSLVGANLLAWSLAAVALLRPRGEVIRWFVAATFGLVALLGASVLADAFFAPRVAVVVPATVEALAGPADDAVLRFELHAGSEVRVVEQREGWLRVALPDDQQGWIPATTAEVVSGWRG